QARTDAATRYQLIALHGEQRDSATARGVALVESRLRAAGVRLPRADS
ncbi:MAG: MerR family transcriptional regulator, partial [Nonomuraea sp.]|nr:MerR family transcriptional regulator [Nonomuraea sp.]